MNFASDNVYGVHQQILDALSKANHPQELRNLARLE